MYPFKTASLAPLLVAVLASACTSRSESPPPKKDAPQATTTAATGAPASTVAPAIAPTTPPATPAGAPAAPAGASGTGSGAAPASSPPQGEVTTATGLKYVDLKQGTGPSPTSGQSVTVHYTGWLTSGTKFDSSVDQGIPFTFRLGQGEVIKGWDEGVATMKVGGKRKLTIPPELGYGSRARGTKIPANSTLVFEVELLGIK